MDSALSLPAIVSVEYLWDPEVKWYACDAATIQWGLEGGMTEAAEGEPEAFVESVDPEKALWLNCLEEAAADGKPEVVLPDRDLTDTVWQAKKKEREAAPAEEGSDKENGRPREVSIRCWQALCAHYRCVQIGLPRRRRKVCVPLTSDQ